MVDPLFDLLTVIVTTSPTPSAPSTELLASVLDSFRSHCPGLLSCRVILVLDTYDQVAARLRLKKGQVTPEVAAAYEEYKQKASRLILAEYLPGVENHAFAAASCHESEYGGLGSISYSVKFTATATHDGRVTILEPAERLGFGLAIRSALRIVTTPYVWVQQHDWALVADLPVQPLAELMRASGSEGSSLPPIEYVCFPSVRMLRYAESSLARDHPCLKETTDALKRSFTASPSLPGVELPLTPMFFWHDKPHLASTEHYLARVFPSRVAIQRGGFIEDIIGQRARDQMKEGHWAKWATWMYYPDEGNRLCLRHLQGRTFRGAQLEMEQRARYEEENRARLRDKLGEHETAPDTITGRGEEAIVPGA